jgi:uncharacterized protein YbcI|tara:strand:- start:3383 stop:3520 length:138 start_codon:yes stop_codon:yes gene_type:complete
MLLEQVITDVTGNKVFSMHMDISIVTGKKMILFITDENVEKNMLD